MSNLSETETCSLFFWIRFGVVGFGWQGIWISDLSRESEVHTKRVYAAHTLIGDTASFHPNDMFQKM